jgi:hypothetical protein
MYLENMVGLVVLAGLTGAMLVVVPLERIRRLAVFGLIFGVGLPFVVIGVMQNLLGLWSYRGVDPVTIAGIPVLTALSWFPGVILFAHLYIENRLPALRLLLFVIVGAGVTLLHYLLLINNMLAFRNWTLTGTFILTVAIHAGLVAALRLQVGSDLKI